eukprot:Skav206728  [mRNA]  locus=scaffold2159:21962:26909:+ [translate_table: standard]
MIVPPGGPMLLRPGECIDIIGHRRVARTITVAQPQDLPDDWHGDTSESEASLMQIALQAYHSRTFSTGITHRYETGRFLRQLRSFRDHSVSVTRDKHNPTFLVESYFLSYPHHGSCHQSRKLRVHGPSGTWRNQISGVWADLLDFHRPFEFYLVLPQPPRTPTEGGEPAVHVLLIQDSLPDHSGVLLTVVEAGQTSRIAVFVPELASRRVLLLASGLISRCYRTELPVHCEIWHSGFVVLDRFLLEVDNGFGFFVGIFRVAGTVRIPEDPLAATLEDASQIPHTPATSQQPDHGSTGEAPVHQPVEAHESDEIGHLQIASKLSPGERPVSLDLYDLLGCSADQKDAVSRHRLWNSVDDQEVIVHLIPAEPDDLFPPFLPVPAHHTFQSVVDRLSGWGHHHSAVRLWPRDAYFCFRPTLTGNYTVLLPVEDWNPAHIFTYAGCSDGTPIDHMKFLLHKGMLRATILRTVDASPQVRLVYYHNNVPSLDSGTAKPKEPTDWPEPQPPRSFGLSFVPRSCDPLPAGPVFDIGKSLQDIADSMNCMQFQLCQDWTHLDLPDATWSFMSTLPCWDMSQDFRGRFDRYLIFTDGSSKPANRHKSALWNDEHGTHHDAWAFIVVAERYDHSPHLTLLGWHSQVVIHDPHGIHFTGADRACSALAEQEAMLWSGLWRLFLNDNTSTCFCTDSSMTQGQSLGLMNCHSDHSTFRALRAVHQALQAALTDQHYKVHHVAAHAGDPLNECVDCLARFEATNGHRLPRFVFPFHEWKHALPHAFDQGIDLPPWTPCGLGLTCPERIPPPVQPIEQTKIIETHHFDIRIGSANVNSLFVGPHGYAGKLSFLRNQMRERGFLALGIQEARSPAGLTQSDGILRFASGSDQGHHGIELWIDLSRKFAPHGSENCRFRPDQFVVTHATPRLLIVHAVHPLLEGLWAPPVKQQALHRTQINRATVQLDLQHRRQPWLTDVQTQCDALTTEINEQAHRQCGRAPVQPKKPFIGSSAWQLRQAKLAGPDQGTLLPMSSSRMSTLELWEEPNSS